MYSLIIIDDDAKTSNNLGNYFPWEEHGFKVKEMFYDARAAYNYLQKNTVDLVISDIKMPVMDGIELARLMWEQKRKEILFFISGYKDFEYARKAIEYGVSYYCLKPLTYKEIKDKLCCIRERLDARKEMTDRRTGEETNITDKLIKKIKAYIDVNYKNASLESVADYVQMNPSYLSRFFKANTGENLSNYIVRTRMKKALVLLQNDELKTIYEIGNAVGYSNPVSFAKTFSKIYGVTPSAYRQNFESINSINEKSRNPYDEKKV